MEDDYGMIDGIINNGPKEDKSAEKGEKWRSTCAAAPLSSSPMKSLTITRLTRQTCRKIQKRKRKGQGKDLCIMEMCITAYSVMENAVHSTWKSKGQLSHVLQTAFPTTP